MNSIKGLYIILCFMQATILMNVTFFNGQFDGIAMFINTILFIFGSIFFGSTRQRKNMKGLYIILCFIQAVILTNVTFFNGQFDGIAMFITTMLFIFGCIFYISAHHPKTSTK